MLKNRAMPGADFDRDQGSEGHSRTFTAFGERVSGRSRIQGFQVNKIKAEGIQSLLKEGKTAWQQGHLQASHSLPEGRVQQVQAVGLSHADGVHRVAVPGRA